MLGTIHPYLLLICLCSCAPYVLTVYLSSSKGQKLETSLISPCIGPRILIRYQVFLKHSFRAAHVSPCALQVSYSEILLAPT